MKQMLPKHNDFVLQTYEFKVIWKSQIYQGIQILSSLGKWRKYFTQFSQNWLQSTYLSISADSFTSEWLFSTAKHIISDQQNSFDPERAEMFLFINKNLHLFTNHMLMLIIIC